MINLLEVISTAGFLAYIVGSFGLLFNPTTNMSAFYFVLGLLVQTLAQIVLGVMKLKKQKEIEDKFLSALLDAEQKEKIKALFSSGE